MQTFPPNLSNVCTLPVKFRSRILWNSNCKNHEVNQFLLINNNGCWEI